MENKVTSISKYMTQARQKRKNLSDILAFIVERGQTTRREIERETGFSWGTVSESVAELVSRGYLAEVAQSAGTVGRQSTVLTLSGDKVVAIGVDVNTTAVSACVVGFDQATVWNKVVPFEARTQEEVIDMLIGLIGSAVAECGDRRIMGIGVAMQGAVDSASGVSVHFPSVGSWTPVDLGGLIEKRFGIPALIEHDPRCLLFARTVKSKIKDGILLRVDNGIGLAVIQDGRLLTDCDRLEVGHTIVKRNGEPCTCGRRGCLEAYSSIRGIERLSGLEFAEVAGGKMGELLDQAGEYLAVSTFNLCVMFAPQKVILTGKLAENERFATSFSQNLAEIAGDAQVDVEFDFELSASYGVAVAKMREEIKKNVI